MATAWYLMLSWKYWILALVGFFVVVAILVVSSGFMGRSAKMSDGFMILGELTIAIGHGRLTSFGVTDKYNQLLKPKCNIS